MNLLKIRLKALTVGLVVLTFSIVASSFSSNQSLDNQLVPVAHQQVEERHNAPSASNCSSVCSAEEFSFILERIINNYDILKKFSEVEDSLGAGNSSSKNDVRLVCVRELVGLIKSLASNELEMKTMLEFANDPSGKISLENIGTSSNANSSRPTVSSLDLTQIKWLNTGQLDVNRSCNGVSGSDSPLTRLNTGILLNVDDSSLSSEASERSQFMHKLVANVDNWINTLERFTITREWRSLLKVFQGTETILNMFLTTTTSKEQMKVKLPKLINLTGNDSLATSQSRVKAIESNSSESGLNLEMLKQNLPTQVLTLTSSLNHLFPWHVWLWNNVDLYNTIDTFLNHGIFAFSKTTVGPDKRIDFLPDMMEILFRSLKYDSFPKKCIDWSKIICDKDSYHDRLVLPPLTDETPTSLKEREAKVREIALVNKNQLTQELTCIMFSSLSMQRFGAAQEQDHTEKSEGTSDGAPSEPISTSSSSRLAWDIQVHKAIKLYTLAREALTDEQWVSLYNLGRDLWAQQKISDRVIMVSRVIQLLTNCHMPKEMLESALWKDIYKFKNVLNQLLDIVIEEINRSSETGKLTTQQLSLGSKSLDEILFKFIRFLPKLIESLSQTIVDQLPELVGRFFSERIAFFKAPCKGYSFSDIIPNLSTHRVEILEIEELVCQQLRTKPNITMMQINNLTNDFLAMALNFGNFSSALTLPKLLTTTVPRLPSMLDEQEPLTTSNVTSIIDEMAANPRLSQIVAILQSSALDPPEVHAELPELDWVEAGTSVALLYESIQKLLSYENVFIIFPEIENFQENFRSHVDASRTMFKKFSKRDPIKLVAYSLDAAMPIALRTFKPMESFHSECISSLKDIFSEDVEAKVATARQWQCLVSSINFAPWAINNVMRTFNSMFKNILGHVSADLASETHTRPKMNDSSTCIFFDGSVRIMLDNLAQFVDLGLETVLMASTTLDQQLTLYDIMCSSKYMLDPFNERAVELKAKMKDKMCHLFHKKSLSNCAQVLKVDQWTSMMKDMNNTWFESSALSIKPSFREITTNAHEFLELFGQFKPSTMSDSLISRVLNVNSFWTNLLNRIASIIDKYQEKRFEYALQTLTPIIYDNLPTKTSVSQDDTNLKEVRETLITTILGAKAILSYLDKLSLSNATSIDNSTINQFEVKLQNLFNWADQYSMVTVETVLTTMANNITKMETIFEPKSRMNMNEIWLKFCRDPVNKYLLTDTVDSIQFIEGKKVICNFNWTSFHRELVSDSDRILAEYPERQLIRIALTKWGQVLDVMLIESKNIKHLPKFFYMSYWQLFQEKLPQISPYKDQPSNLVWIWKGFETLINSMDGGTNQTSHTLIRILDQLNCGLDAVKGGLSWDNIAIIYQDKQDILAAHSTINHGFALAHIGVNTVLANDRFQLFLDTFIKPRTGLSAFCELRNRSKLQSIFSIPDGQDFIDALESFQELICDTNFETLAQNINPISVCYQFTQTNTSSSNPLADIIDRFFKLASLAIMDAKLVATSETKPPVLDKDQWNIFWSWWTGKLAEPELKSSVALTVVRAFQTLDSINSDHVVWKALFKSIHEVSEVVAYLLRAVEKKHSETDSIGASSRLSLVKEAASQLDIALRSNITSKQIQHQQLASTLSNIMFPEVNNFISFRTFKQLRYIKSIIGYFSNTPEAQEAVCRQTNHTANQHWERVKRIQLIGYKLNTNERLYSLLCYYPSTQWLTALNVVISTRTSSIPKKVNYMTKYLSIFTRHHKDNENLKSFIHSQQLYNIEQVATTSISYVMATSHSLKTLSFSKISNISWHSLPNLLDSLDRHLCASKYEHGAFQIPVYEPKKPELETLICKLPQWNTTQIYSYLSENFDLQNMISLLISQQNLNISLPKLSLPASNSTMISKSLDATNSQVKICATPFKFASRWLKIAQEIADDAMSKSSRDKIRKCLSSIKKGQSFKTQSLRYVKFINGLLTSINDLVASDSWPIVKRTWSSISYLLLNQSSSEEQPTSVGV